MNRFQEHYKKNGLTSSNRAERRIRNFNINRKNKRSEALDSRREKELSDFEDSITSTKPKSALKVDLKAKSRLKKETSTKLQQPPFIVGIVRHKIHSPPFLHDPIESTEQSKNCCHYSGQTFAPKNYKLKSPKEIKFNIFTPKIDENCQSSSSFTLRSLLSKFADKKDDTQGFNFENVNMQRRKRKYSFDSPLSITSDIHDSNENKKNYDRVKKHLWAEDLEKVPIFGRQNVINAKQKSESKHCKDEKENITPLIIENKITSLPQLTFNCKANIQSTKLKTDQESSNHERPKSENSRENPLTTSKSNNESEDKIPIEQFNNNESESNSGNNRFSPPPRNESFHAATPIKAEKTYNELEDKNDQGHEELKSEDSRKIKRTATSPDNELEVTLPSEQFNRDKSKKNMVKNNLSTPNNNNNFSAETPLKTEKTYNELDEKNNEHKRAKSEGTREATMRTSTPNNQLETTIPAERFNNDKSELNCGKNQFSLLPSSENMIADTTMKNEKTYNEQEEKNVEHERPKPEDSREFRQLISTPNNESEDTIPLEQFKNDKSESDSGNNYVSPPSSNENFNNETPKKADRTPNEQKENNVEHGRPKPEEAIETTITTSTSNNESDDINPSEHFNNDKSESNSGNNYVSPPSSNENFNNKTPKKAEKINNEQEEKNVKHEKPKSEDSREITMTTSTPNNQLEATIPSERFNNDKNESDSGNNRFSLPSNNENMRDETSMKSGSTHNEPEGKTVEHGRPKPEDSIEITITKSTSNNESDDIIPSEHLNNDKSESNSGNNYVSPPSSNENFNNETPKKADRTPNEQKENNVEHGRPKPEEAIETTITTSTSNNESDDINPSEHFNNDKSESNSGNNYVSPPSSNENFNNKTPKKAEKINNEQEEKNVKHEKPKSEDFREIMMTTSTPNNQLEATIPSERFNNDKNESDSSNNCLSLPPNNENMRNETPKKADRTPNEQKENNVEHEKPKSEDSREIIMTTLRTNNKSGVIIPLEQLNNDKNDSDHGSKLFSPLSSNENISNETSMKFRSTHNEPEGKTVEHGRPKPEDSIEITITKSTSNNESDDIIPSENFKNDKSESDSRNNYVSPPSSNENFNNETPKKADRTPNEQKENNVENERPKPEDSIETTIASSTSNNESDDIIPSEHFNNDKRELNSGINRFSLPPNSENMSNETPKKADSTHNEPEGKTVENERPKPEDSIETTITSSTSNNESDDIIPSKQFNNNNSESDSCKNRFSFSPSIENFSTKTPKKAENIQIVKGEISEEHETPESGNPKDIKMTISTPNNESDHTISLDQFDNQKINANSNKHQLSSQSSSENMTADTTMKAQKTHNKQEEKNVEHERPKPKDSNEFTKLISTPNNESEDTIPLEQFKNDKSESDSGNNYVSPPSSNENFNNETPKKADSTPNEQKENNVEHEKPKSEDSREIIMTTLRTNNKSDDTIPLEQLNNDKNDSDRGNNLFSPLSSNENISNETSMKSGSTHNEPEGKTVENERPKPEDSIETTITSSTSNNESDDIIPSEHFNNDKRELNSGINRFSLPPNSENMSNETPKKADSTPNKQKENNVENERPKPEDAIETTIISSSSNNKSDDIIPSEHFNNDKSESNSGNNYVSPPSSNENFSTETPKKAANTQNIQEEISDEDGNTKSQDCTEITVMPRLKPTESTDTNNSTNLKESRSRKRNKNIMLENDNSLLKQKDQPLINKNNSRDALQLERFGHRNHESNINNIFSSPSYYLRNKNLTNVSSPICVYVENNEVELNDEKLKKLAPIKTPKTPKNQKTQGNYEKDMITPKSSSIDSPIRILHLRNRVVDVSPSPKKISSQKYKKQPIIDITLDDTPIKGKMIKKLIKSETYKENVQAPKRISKKLIDVNGFPESNEIETIDLTSNSEDYSSYLSRVLARHASSITSPKTKNVKAKSPIKTPKTPKTPVHYEKDMNTPKISTTDSPMRILHLRNRMIVSPLPQKISSQARKKRGN